MDGVMEGAAVLSVCKLVCSLCFLPSLATSYSPVSFCCCCLLIFTDFLVTVFLSLFCIFESWLTDFALQRDVVALRFLLFLGHTYGAVLLLTTPLIAAETVTRLPWPGPAVARRAFAQTVGSHQQPAYSEEVTVTEEDEEGHDPDKDSWLSHAVGYLCCLSVWVVVALHVSCRWVLEEVRATACLHSTKSLIRCLPNALSPMPGAMNPFWGMAFVSLLLLVLTSSSGLQKWCQTQLERTHRNEHGVNNNYDCLQDLVPPPALFKPVMSVSESAQPVDPEKTESSCTVHTAYSWNSMQMWARHHGDSVLLSRECLSKGGQEHEMAEHVNSRSRSRCGWRRWGFPSPGVNVMIGSVAVLSIFVLPLYLSVNILLIRSIETLLELCVTSLVSSAALVSHSATSKTGLV